MLTAFGKQPSTRPAKSAFLEEAYKRVYKNALRSVESLDRSQKSEGEHSEGDGREMFQAICKLGLEGIVSKKLNAPYAAQRQKARAELFGASRNFFKLRACLNFFNFAGTATLCSSSQKIGRRTKI
jgi:hypothetical protein